MLRRAAGMFVVFMLCLYISHGQDYLYAVRHIKIESGKLGNYVRCLTRDRSGLLWLGTIRGLVRYNGYEFDRPLDALNDWQLPSPDILSMDVGGDSLFIGTQKGIKVFDVRNFKSIEIPGYVENGASIKVVRYDASSGFWWIREDGHLFNFHRGRLMTFPLNLVPAMEIRIHGRYVWVSGNIRLQKGSERIGKLYRVDKRTRSVREELSTKGDNVNPLIFENTQGRSVYVHDRRFVLLPEADEGLGEWQTSDIDYTFREEVGDERFMVVNQNQLIHEYKVADKWKRARIPIDISEPYSIYKIFPVGDRLILATTVGLINIGYRRNAFFPIRSTLIKENGIFEDPRGITEDDEHIFITGYHSISAWRKSDSSLRLINAQDLLTHGAISYRKHLWLATEGNGLIKLDPATGRYDLLVKDTTYRNNFLISTAAWGDTILFGGYRSFNAYLPGQDRFLNPFIRHDSLIVSDLMIKKILPLNKYKCLLGTDKGIFIIDRDFKILKHFRPTDPKQRPGIDIINDVVIGQKGNIWMATFDGIIEMDSSARMIRHITVQEGLSGDFVASLVADARGNLWAGTYEGLSRIDPTSGSVTNFYRADGLPDNEFNHSSVHVARSGDIFMGTISGFIRFDPNMASRNSGRQQRIRISRAEYGRGEDVKVYLNVPFGDEDVLHIGPDVKYLKLHFFSDPMQASEQSIYEYRIDGIHERWMKMGPTPILHIDNVRSGKYTLHVRFISGTGSEDIIERSYSLIVEQFFYTRPAFYAAIIGTMMIFVILYVRAIMMRDQKLLEVRQELAADLHDEVGGYLAGMLMKIDLLSKGTEVRETQLKTLRNLATKAVFGLKDGLWSLDSKTDNAQQLWDRFKRIVQESLEPLNIPYRFSSTDRLHAVPLTLIEKRNLLFILKECLNNAIKHGDGKGVLFEWKLNSSGKYCIMVRNGIGVDSTKMAGGLGLDNMERRIRRIRGAMVANQLNGIYTVEININLRHDQIGRD